MVPILQSPTAGASTALQSIDPPSGGLASPGTSALGDFWSLVEQAGPLRWPIFAVLAIGLVLVFSKLYELMRDRAASRELHSLDHRTKSLAEITAVVSRQGESMLASLQSTMLNVFHTRPTEGMLHDEIANFVAFQQNQFGAFRRRMEFLSDTAGALGLMGTVWGMFEVFFQGTSDQDVILRGMGIALITTLLGLVVSILLNLSTTELSTYFGKRLEQISLKSDELRFRLLELAAHGAPRAPVPAAPVVARPAQEVVAPPPASPPPTEPPRPRTAEKPTSPAAWYLEPDRSSYRGRVGETLADVRFTLRNGDSPPRSGVALVLSVGSNGGRLEDGEREIRRMTDAKGSVRVAWTLPERVGTYVLDAAVPEHPGAARRIEAVAGPDKPHRAERSGAHQAAVAGMRLPQPLAVCVFDRFGNPVPGIDVTFAVERGGGRLAQAGRTAVVPTDERGTAKCAFAVDAEPGTNAVRATVDGLGDALEFMAFGTEV